MSNSYIRIMALSDFPVLHHIYLVYVKLMDVSTSLTISQIYYALISMLYQDTETSNISSTECTIDNTDDVDDRQKSVDESEEDDTSPDSPPL